LLSAALGRWRPHQVLSENKSRGSASLAVRYSFRNSSGIGHVGRNSPRLVADDCLFAVERRAVSFEVCLAKVTLIF
jgi:hypothetical protein